MSVARTLNHRTMCFFSRVAYPALMALVVASQPVDAIAQPNPSFELEWNAPSSCPQEFEVKEQIRAMLGAAPGATLPSGLRARGELEPINERFQLTLTVRVGQTERARVIASDDCTSLGKAAAVILGLLIRREHESGRQLSDSDLGSDFQQPAVPTRSQVPVAPPEKPKSTVAPSQTPDAQHQRLWHVLIMGPTATVDYFTLPKLGYGIGVGAGVVHGSWRWFASGTLWGTQHQARDGVAAYEATYARQSFETWVCRGWRLDGVELSPCALAAIDVLGAGAWGSRLTNNSRRIVLASAGVGLVGFWHATAHFGFFLAVTGRVAFRRPGFMVTDATGIVGAAEAHTIPWATTLTSIGSEWIF